jgi:hypothetical protein
MVIVLAVPFILNSTDLNSFFPKASVFPAVINKVIQVHSVTTTNRVFFIFNSPPLDRFLINPRWVNRTEAD